MNITINLSIITNIFTYLKSFYFEHKIISIFCMLFILPFIVPILGRILDYYLAILNKFIKTVLHIENDTDGECFCLLFSLGAAIVITTVFACCY